MNTTSRWALLLLTLVSFTACRGGEDPPLRELTAPVIDVAVPTAPEPLRAWAPPSRSERTVRVDANWPPPTTLHGIHAPEGEAFLWALPLPSANAETSYLATTVPIGALKASLYDSFSVTQPPTWSLLLYPSHDALAEGEDSDIQRIDELGHLRLPTRANDSEAADFDSFYVELTQDKLIQVCVPSVAPEAPARAGTKLSNRCEFYLWDPAKSLQPLPLSLQGERSFRPPTTSALETSIEGFSLNEDGTLEAWLRVPLPRREGLPETVELPIAWETSPLQTQTWSKTQLSQELRSWQGLAPEQAEETQALFAAGRLLALRFIASDVIETKDAYLEFESEALLQIAAITKHHWGLWEAWAWLAQLNELLDQHADQTLARPHASLMLLPEDAEKPSLPWRGEGQLLDRAIPATWQTGASGPLLRMPRTAGVRYCTPKHCQRSLEEPNRKESGLGDSAGPLEEPAPPPSLHHPEGRIQLLDCWPADNGVWSLIFSTTERQQRCEPDALCAATCDSVSYPSLSRLSKFQGPSYARVSLSADRGPKQSRATARATTRASTSNRGMSQTMNFACADASLSVERPQPLFWLDNETLLFSDETGFYQANVAARTWGAFDVQGLSDAQRAVAGVGRDGEHYILRHVAHELSVWRRRGDVLELLALPNLRHPSAPQSAHGWALPNPEGSELAVVFGGQLIGVWELSPAPASSADDAADEPVDAAGDEPADDPANSGE